MKRVVGLLVTTVAVGIGGVLFAQPAHAAGPMTGQAMAGVSPGRPWQVTVTVQTVPPLPGVRLTFDGVTMKTNSQGQASYTGQHDFAGHSLTLIDSSISTSDRHYRFERWSGQRDPDQAFKPEVTGLPLRADYTITAAFSVHYPVTPRFVDEHGSPIAAGNVSTAVVQSEAGTVMELQVDGTTWLLGSMPYYRKSVIELSDISYSLQSVIIDGTNAIDAGKQRFRPGTDSTVMIKVPFHDLRISGHDALFGWTAGTSAVVTGPDGATRVVGFGSDGTALLSGLPRGKYNVDIRGADGVVLSRQITLSRDATVDVTVVGWSNLGLLAGVCVLVAVGLLLAGRPQWRLAILATPARVRWVLAPSGPVPGYARRLRARVASPAIRAVRGRGRSVRAWVAGLVGAVRVSARSAQAWVAGLVGAVRDPVRSVRAWVVGLVGAVRDYVRGLASRVVSLVRAVWHFATRVPLSARAEYVLVVIIVGLMIAMMAATLVVLTPGPARAHSTSREAEPAIGLFAYYYVWFDPSSWNRAKTDYPQLGRYSSDDARVMRQHIEWAKSAGIQGFIVSWKDTPTNNRRLRLLMSVARELDFMLAMIYQGLDFERRPQPVARVAADFITFQNEFATDPVFVRLGGKPLTIWSGTWSFSRDDIATVTKPVRASLLVLATERNVDDFRRVSDVTDGDAYYWSSVNPRTNTYYVEKLADMAAAVHADGKYWMAPFAPGFDARLVGGTREVARMDGEIMRQQYAAAVNSSPDLLGLISWNEFSENSHVEPSERYGTRYLDVLRELRGTPPPNPPSAVDSNEYDEVLAMFHRYWPNVLVLLGFPAFIVAGTAGLTIMRRRSRRLSTIQSHGGRQL